MNTLNDLKINESAKIKSLDITGAQLRRMNDLGFIRGTTIKKIFESPFGDPCAYLVRGSVIALRNINAEKIHITTQGESYA